MPIRFSFYSVGLLTFLTNPYFFSNQALANTTPYRCLSLFKTTHAQRSLEYNDLEPALQQNTLFISQDKKILPLRSAYKSHAASLIEKLGTDWGLEFVIADNGAFKDLITNFETLQSPRSQVVVSSELLRHPVEFSQALQNFKFQFDRLQDILDRGLILKYITVSDSGLEFQVRRVRHPVKDLSLRWIQTAIEKFKIDVYFSHSGLEPEFLEINGFSRQNGISLNSDFILPSARGEFLDKINRSYLAHELVHAFRYQMSRLGKTETMSFFVGENDEQIFPGLSAAYQKVFRTDEFEAWKMSAHYFGADTPIPSERFLIQLPWLRETQEVLADKDFTPWETYIEKNLYLVIVYLRESNVFVQFDVPLTLTNEKDLQEYLKKTVAQRIQQLGRFIKKPSPSDEIPF